jgi:hypothetical protein
MFIVGSISLYNEKIILRVQQAANSLLVLDVILPPAEKRVEGGEHPGPAHIAADGEKVRWQQSLDMRALSHFSTCAVQHTARYPS